jgi:hypothetical protein
MKATKPAGSTFCRRSLHEGDEADRFHVLP